MTDTVDTSADYVRKVCNAAPFADNIAGIPQMVELIRALAAEITTLRAELAEAGEHRKFLWALLDDIDTLDDACKEHDKAFRKRAYKIQRRRYEISSSDGYTVTFLSLKTGGNENG